MKLCECNLGQIVVDLANKKRIGHIIGLIYNTTIPEYYKLDNTEIIPLVQFVGEQLPVGIHYGNIDKFKTY